MIWRPDEIIEIVSEYFIDYFGKENKSLIEDRLKRTDLFFVTPSTADKYAKQCIINNYWFVGHRKNEAFNQYEKDVIEVVKKVADPDHEWAGQCMLMTCKDNKGEIYDLLRGVFVLDYNDYRLMIDSNLSLPSYSDTCIIHELLHAISQYVKNNEMYNGFEGVNDTDANTGFNELFVENMAIDISKKLHLDGITFNESVSLKNKHYYSSAYLKKLNFKIDDFINSKKEYLKQAFLTGAYDKGLYEGATPVLFSLKPDDMPKQSQFIALIEQREKAEKEQLLMELSKCWKEQE